MTPQLCINKSDIGDPTYLQFLNMILIDIYGNSMEPELKHGDTVMIDTSQKDIQPGLKNGV